MIEFCQEFLKSCPIGAGKKEAMMQRVTARYGQPGQETDGISLDEFVNFHRVLFCSADLARALFYTNTQKRQGPFN